MKTIAVTIDEETLAALDRLLGARRKGKRPRRGNRSEVVRRALRLYLAQRARTEREAAEWKIWERHVDRINRQAAALVSEQAEP